jgi:hypothetical protein
LGPQPGAPAFNRRLDRAAGGQYIVEFLDVGYGDGTAEAFDVLAGDRMRRVFMPLILAQQY